MELDQKTGEEVPWSFASSHWPILLVSPISQIQKASDANQIMSHTLNLHSIVNFISIKLKKNM